MALAEGFCCWPIARALRAVTARSKLRAAVTGKGQCGATSGGSKQRKADRAARLARKVHPRAPTCTLIAQKCANE